MTESREHWSSWDSLYTLSEDTLGEEMEAWESFQFSSLEKTELWAAGHQHYQSTGDLQAAHSQCGECQVRQEAREDSPGRESDPLVPNSDEFSFQMKPVNINTTSNLPTLFLNKKGN